MTPTVNPAVGIDLGTTNTVVAVQTEDFAPRILPIRQPTDTRKQYELLPEIKSAVYFESPNSAVVGHFAAQRVDGIRSIKSKMGTRWRIANPQKGGPLLGRGRPAFLSPAYVSAHILKLAFDSVLAEYPQWDRSAVITVPAAFNTDQRADTLAAARHAGFEVVELLDEPTAAFYTYFDQNRDSDEFSKPTTTLVFDFGGGTLDVSIIRVEPRGDGVDIDAIGRSRFNDLGGDDIDLDIAVHMLAQWEQGAGLRVNELADSIRERLYRRFIQAASDYKERSEERIAEDLPLDDFFLSETITDGVNNLDIQLSLLLSRDQYDLITGQFFDNKREVNIYRPVEQAFSLAAQIDPEFSKSRIDYVLYTGGASQMHGVQSALRAYFAPTPCEPIGGSGAACRTVAIGAAAFRYDQMKRQAVVRMSRRTLEAILTRPDPLSDYIVLVPVTAQQSQDFKAIGYTFALGSDQVRARIPLFRGTGPQDHQISPIRDVILDLPHLIRENTPFTLAYRVSTDKTIDLQADFADETVPPIRGSARLDQDDDQRADAVSLFPINE